MVSSFLVGNINTIESFSTDWNGFYPTLELQVVIDVDADEDVVVFVVGIYPGADATTVAL